MTETGRMGLVVDGEVATKLPALLGRSDPSPTSGHGVSG